MKLFSFSTKKSKSKVCAVTSNLSRLHQQLLTQLPTDLDRYSVSKTCNMSYYSGRYTSPNSLTTPYSGKERASPSRYSSSYSPYSGGSSGYASSYNSNYSPTHYSSGLSPSQRSGSVSSISSIGSSASGVSALSGASGASATRSNDNVRFTSTIFVAYSLSVRKL